jgi:hypothetical protein
MAGTIAGSLQPKYTSYYADVCDEQGRAALEAQLAFARAIKIQALEQVVAAGREVFDAAYKALVPPFTADHFPHRVQLTQGKRVFDYNRYIAGGPAVSQRFKDAVEAIEPRVHQFFPVELLHKDGRPYGEPLYYWNITQAIDAIRPDLGGVYERGDPNHPGTHSWVISSGVSDRDRTKLAVDAATIAGRAAWRDVRMVSRTFVSDALIGALRAEGMEGWELTTEWAEI